MSDNIFWIYALIIGIIGFVILGFIMWVIVKLMQYYGVI